MPVLKAPRRSGERLMAPPIDQWETIWRRNQSLVQATGDFIRVLRASARRECIDAAARYTRQYRDVDGLPLASDRVILAGHQPDLFHPGVWFKNFVLSGLGKRFDANPIQFLVDNDVYRQAAIRVPTGTIEQPRWISQSFDRLEAAVPFECARISDRELFDSFAGRVTQSIRPFVREPLIEPFWATVQQEYQRTDNVGRALAAARHRLEADFGLQTLELPFSELCRSRTFCAFAAEILERCESFATIHNQTLADFRRRHKLRSHSHPVPDLEINGPEIETPFWVWSTQSPHRRRLYVRRTAQSITLLDRQTFVRTFTAQTDFVDQLQQLDSEGIALRPRALLTTMFARLVLSDLFVHGIGGAVYDEVTDDIVRAFFDCEPPQFLTVTATIHLPIDGPEVDESELSRIDHELRGLVYHPEKYVDEGNGEVRSLVDSKFDWIRRSGPDVDLKARHEAIRQINQRLAARLTTRADALRLARQKAAADLDRARILCSREYSLVLFPHSLGEKLRELASFS